MSAEASYGIGSRRHAPHSVDGADRRPMPGRARRRRPLHPGRATGGGDRLGDRRSRPGRGRPGGSRPASTPASCIGPRTTRPWAPSPVASTWSTARCSSSSHAPRAVWRRRSRATEKARSRSTLRHRDGRHRRRQHVAHGQAAGRHRDPLGGQSRLVRPADPWGPFVLYHQAMTAGPTVRPATDADAEAIATLFTDEGYPAGPSDIRERLSRFDSTLLDRPRGRAGRRRGRLRGGPRHAALRARRPHRADPGHDRRRRCARTRASGTS